MNAGPPPKALDWQMRIEAGIIRPDVVPSLRLSPSNTGATLLIIDDGQNKVTIGMHPGYAQTLGVSLIKLGAILEASTSAPAAPEPSPIVGVTP